MLRIGSVVINVSDLPRAVAFWSAALGYEPVGDPQPDWTILGPFDGNAVRVSLNLSNEVPPDVPHVHLDLYLGDHADQSAEIERLVGLGATRVDWPLYPDGEADFVVLADPDGNRFCIIDH